MSYKDIACLDNLQPTTTPIDISLPDGSVITSTHTATLRLPGIPIECCVAHIFPDLVTSLLSISLFADAGLQTTYVSDEVVISENDITLLSGMRDPATGLWMIDLDQPAPRFMMALKHLPETHRQLVANIHKAWGSPAVSTFLDAVNKGYIKVPGLTATMIRRYSPDTIITSKGHLDQCRQGIRSTKHTNKQASAVLVKVELSDQRHTDLTGQFPIPSKCGHLYHMVMYCENNNYIHIELLKSRTSSEFVSAYARGTEFFKSRGTHPLYERLDNETSKALEIYCKQQNIQIQYVPPGNHRANKAERAIRTWKNHFISTLSGLDPTFPMTAWDELVPQAELTLNTLRGSNHDDSISAWESLNGPYSFDRNPIAPLGMVVLCHDKPDSRASWAPHGTPGYYIGPAMQHYRCFRVWIPSTS
jgi:hypothetical protein